MLYQTSGIHGWDVTAQEAVLFINELMTYSNSCISKYKEHMNIENFSTGVDFYQLII
jgi:hypothetical protein